MPPCALVPVSETETAGDMSRFVPCHTGTNIAANLPHEVYMSNGFPGKKKKSRVLQKRDNGLPQRRGKQADHSEELKAAAPGSSH